MLVHIKDRPVPTFVNYFLHQSDLTIDISSKEGHGSTLKLKIPLTLAVIAAIIIESNGQVFAIPQANLMELVRIENKTYGICRETGKMIPKERLRAVPHATLSIEAKNNKR